MITANCRESIDDEQSRRALALVVTLLLDAWEVPPAQQAALLGLRLSQLTACRAGGSLPRFGTSVERAAELIAIDQALGLAFPIHPDPRYRWVTRPHPFFDRPPLAVMMSGLAGIRRVKRLVGQIPR